MEPAANRPDDPETLKAGIRQQWDHAARGWDKHDAILGQWLESATTAMIDLSGIASGWSVLDVAAGTGAQSVEILGRIGETGRLVATDISPASVAIAAARLANIGHPGVSAQAADCEALPFEDRVFDAVTCRLGLMFLPRPLQGLREIRRVLRPGGRACCLVFSGPAANPCVTTLMRVATRHAGLPPPDPARAGGLLSLGKADLLASLYREAGFDRVRQLVISAPFRLPGASDYVDFVRDGAAPVVAILSRLPEQGREEAYAEMTRSLAEFETGEGWDGPNELLLVWGEA